MKRKPAHIPQQDWDAVDSLPLSDEMLARMKPVRESHPNIPTRVRGSERIPGTERAK